jgi:hypothetical protein
MYSLSFDMKPELVFKLFFTTQSVPLNGFWKTLFTFNYFMGFVNDGCFIKTVFSH